MKLSIPTRSHTIRFPGDLYDKIHLMSDDEGRTFNGQVVWLLQVGYATYKKYCDDFKRKADSTSIDETVKESTGDE